MSRLAGDNLVGGADANPLTIAATIHRLRLIVAAVELGAAQRAIDYAAKYAVDRIAFGHPIAGFQGVSFPLAESQMQLAALRLEIADVASRLDTEAFADLSEPVTGRDQLCRRSRFRSVAHRRPDTRRPWFHQRPSGRDLVPVVRRLVRPRLRPRCLCVRRSTLKEGRHNGCLVRAQQAARRLRRRFAGLVCPPGASTRPPGRHRPHPAGELARRPRQLPGTDRQSQRQER